MTKVKKSGKKPPSKSIQSLQYELFSQFLSNDASEVSNAIEYWESIPKYLVTPAQAKKLRNSDGLAKPYKWEYRQDGRLYTVKIQPALIEQADGSYKAQFPSITEELIEEALKKIFTDQHYGIHDPANLETWVRFTLKMLQRELKEQGRSRDINQIKLAIEVMSKSVITLYNDDVEVWSGSILQDLTTIGRKEYLAEPDSYHIARLPLFVSHGINKLEYRQFNYKRLMACNEQLTRWIYKQLIHRYRQASIGNSYHFMYSTIKNSGLLQQGTEARNRQKVISALNELKEQGAIKDYEDLPRKEGRAISDVKYTVWPSQRFIAEQKAANKRASDGKTKLLEST